MAVAVGTVSLAGHPMDVAGGSSRGGTTEGTNTGSEQTTEAAGPDLAQGVAASDFKGETLLGHVGDQEILLVRYGPEIFAIDAHCSHYHGPLADGLVADGAVRCPWHHACFDLRTGEAIRAPAFNALDVWKVEQRDGRIFVRDNASSPRSKGDPPIIPRKS